MTLLERARQFVSDYQRGGRDWYDLVPEMLAAEFRAVIAEEREACAKLVEGSEYMGDDMKTHPIKHRDALAVAIRARAQEGDT